MVTGGGFRQTGKVIFFNAVLYSKDHVKDPDEFARPLFGDPILKSAEFDFSHTSYYEPEMGANLAKYFALYDLVEHPDNLPDYKIHAVSIEDSLAIGKHRVINIDPGYVAMEKIIAASTKNFTHRIYLRDNIYGDLQLYRRKGSYVPLEWTFQDYQFDFVLGFFEKARKILEQRIGMPETCGIIQEKKRPDRR
ncbi:DUF4416 family protein [Seleniivibrio sp.]|uniref:DUF4416 family protein n=1 Tax=Seleniivibrio sp. TaxID=2898801 RepID=UPI0025EA21F6|nr:DUF4416 family protein [Seleniivibrio sp.]MCD8554694.1 DUF4416 family protein [Seleniivibrio sp.]